MGRTYEIKSISLKTNIHRFVNYEQFTFRADKKWPWLQKICFAILRKLDAHSIGETVEIERGVIDGDKLIAAIYEQKVEIQTLFNMLPKQLFIGTEDYAEMMREEIATTPFNFQARCGYNEHIMGLSVKVIPWMRGILVVP